MLRRCGLVGGSVSLRKDFEISKSHAKPRLSLSPSTSPEETINLKANNSMILLRFFLF